MKKNIFYSVLFLFFLFIFFTFFIGLDKPNLYTPKELKNKNLAEFSSKELFSNEQFKSNDIIQNNSQVPGSNNEVLADNINYSNSTIYYLNQQGNGIDITSQSDDIKSLMFDFQFSSDGETIRMQGQTLPYNLRIGRALSYHE